MKESTSWWDDFVNDDHDDSIKDVICIANKLEEKEELKEEDVLYMTEMIGEIEKKGYDKSIINTLEKKQRIYEKRRERKVSKEFGAFIRYLREKQGITLAEMSKKTGISSSYINRLELAQRNSPSIIIVEKIAKALNTPFIEIAEKSGIDLGLEDEKTEILSVSSLIDQNEVSLHNMGPAIDDDLKKELINIVDYIINAPISKDNQESINQLMDLVTSFKEKTK